MPQYTRACVPAWCRSGADALKKVLPDTVNAYDINATTLRTDDKAVGLTSAARVSYLFELKRWF